MKQAHVKATVEKVKDFSLVNPLDEKGPRKDGTSTVNVSYEYDHDILETKEELDRKFSFEALLNLANQRVKQTANAKARQAAVSPYELPDNAPVAVRDRMIKDMVSQGIPEEVAIAQIDALLASVRATV
ncbi:MAG TPA: hypothetical protein VNX68_04795 [Nitrosopumilaceae archaeon]|nr:hypothetical protein [Nitrosopumilaceae archaeon]